MGPHTNIPRLRQLGCRPSLATGFGSAQFAKIACQFGWLLLWIGSCWVCGCQGQGAGTASDAQRDSDKSGTQMASDAAGEGGENSQQSDSAKNAEALDAADADTVRIGGVVWYRNYDDARVVARERNLPMWLHFGEHPG